MNRGASHPPGVDPHHPDAPLVEPPGRLGAHTRSASDVVLFLVELVAVCAHQDDVAFVQRPRQALGHVVGRQQFAVVVVARIDHHPGTEEPVQGQLIDRLRALAASRRVVVPGSVDVGRVVGPEAQKRLRRPSLFHPAATPHRRRRAARSSRRPRRDPRTRFPCGVAPDSPADRDGLGLTDRRNASGQSDFTRRPAPRPDQSREAFPPA